MVTHVRIALGLILLAGLLAGCASSTPLGAAVVQGDLRNMRALLDQGMDVNEEGACGETAPGGTALMCAAAAGNVEAAKLLIERGAVVNAKRPNWPWPDLGGWTALHFAVWRGHVAMVHFLLEHGAQINDGSVMLCEGFVKCTAIQHAKWTGRTNIVRLLEQAEARELAKLGVPSPGASASAQSEVPPLIRSDVDQIPSSSGRPRKNAYAIVIGIESYREKLPKADFADRDAKLMGEYLTRVMGYPEQNVVVRLNERASRTDLVKYFEEWLGNNIEPGGSVFVYYSGHGAPNPKTGDAYLVPYDGDPAFVDSTAYPLKQLYSALNKLPAKDVTVVLDACFSGAGGRSVIAEGARPMMLSVENPVLAGNKTVVLAASSGTQISSTFKEQGHGLLTYYFLKGLQGDGDLNRDGTIEMKEIFEYIRPQVQRVARKQYNNEQTPQLLGSTELTKGVRLVERAP